MYLFKVKNMKTLFPLKKSDLTPVTLSNFQAISLNLAYKFSESY